MKNVLCTLGVLAMLGLVGTPAPAGEKRRIELGDGHYQIALDPDLGTTPPPFLGGAIEWEYAGQATYFRGSREGLGVRSAVPVVPDVGPSDLMTSLMRSEMVDAHGRRFKVKKVHEGLQREVIEEYDREVEREIGLEPAELTRGDGKTRKAEPQDGIVTPLSWTRSDQDGDGNLDLFLWDGDSRQLVSSPLTDAQKETVLFLGGTTGTDATMCSGVLVGAQFALTAHHCIVDSSGSFLSEAGKICTRGNYYSGADCANVEAIFTNGNYGGTGDMGDDFALLRIDETLGSDNFMRLSQASDSTLEANTAYNLGHPGLTPGGSTNLFYSSGSNCSMNSGTLQGGEQSDAYAPCESRLYKGSGEVNVTRNKVIGTRIDISGGQSGGPIFYLPNGSSGNHFLTGLMVANHKGSSDYNGGPKIPYHRDWIVSVMNANR